VHVFRERDMISDAPHILLASADEAAARQLAPALSTLSCGPAHATAAGSVPATLAALHAGPNFTAVLFDLSLARDDPAGTLAEVRRASPAAALIVLIDPAREETALAALRQGAQDYLVKGHIRPKRLANAICYAIERKRAELALRSERELLRTIIDNLPDPIYVKDSAGRYLLDNTTHVRFLGLTSPDQVAGKTVFDLFPRHLAERFHADDEQVIRSGQPLLNREEPVIDREGNQRWLWTAKVPLRDGSGSIAGLVGISRDITDRKVAEQQLRGAMDQVKASHEELIQAQLQLIQAEKLDSVGRLAAGVAHEVKNPLAVLLMGLDYLAGSFPADGGSSPASTAAVVKAMRDAVRRADAIIRGLVDFSAHRRLELKDADLNATIQNALLLVKHELLATNVTACLDLSPDLPRLRIDENKIQQVFINLFINAIHAMPDGGRLLIRTFSPPAAEQRRADRPVTVQVDDTGHGIPADKLPKLFDPFFTTKPTGKGTGLGLTVAKKIVELHGGTITIHNLPAKGARVSVTFHPSHDPAPDLVGSAGGVPSVETLQPSPP